MKHEAILTNLRKIKAMAEAIGSPLFGVHRLIETAEIIGNQYPAWTEFKDTSKLDADLTVIEKGGEAIAAFVASPFLPDELAAYRENQEANVLICAALDVVNNYIDKQLSKKMDRADSDM